MSRQQSRHRLATALVSTLVFAAAFSDFLSGNRPESQSLDRTFAPPTRIHFVDAGGRFHWRPFIYKYELADPLDVVFREVTDRPAPLRFFADGYYYNLFGVIPTSIHLVAAEGAPFLPLGADELGRDVWARTLAAARTSLFVVMAGLIAYAALGVLVGSLAGIAGRWIDAVLMRFSEFVLALPALYVILALRATLPIRLAGWQALLLTAAVIASVSWPPLARGVRGMILRLRQASFVEAARALGAPEFRLFRLHILPPLLPFVLAQCVVAAPVFLLGEVVLSFLDAGLSDATASWGSMLRSLRNPRVLTDFHWNLSPLLFVFATLLSLNLLGRRWSGRETSRTSV